ncbi:MAG TPA: flavodoxin-dependent (E)-4-hydroxy-3-methylbut-2-enyl-diphosphate synthase, partial [Treponemataceae bacterium]|nr:flavodoxin-dependent (E)-4-hydroxy-3-methylbut-2-enyl-diphosphate synthase [Treponemataceae bacterium]
MSDFMVPRKVSVGGQGGTRRLDIGGDAPVSIQTMWKSPLTGADLAEIAGSLISLGQLGCDVVRFAVPDMESADALVALSSMTAMPLVADIHFDYKLAIRCLEGNVAKIRINPGNIGSRERVKAVVDRARDSNAAIRIGVNSGSLPKDLQQKVEYIRASGEDSVSARADALAEAAEREAAVFDELGFDRYIVSMKASSVRETVLCNEAFARKHDAPLHLGVTEAGPLIGGVV